MKSLSETLGSWASLLRGGNMMAGESAAATLEEASRALYVHSIEGRLEALERRLIMLEGRVAKIPSASPPR